MLVEGVRLCPVLSLSGLTSVEILPLLSSVTGLQPPSVKINDGLKMYPGVHARLRETRWNHVPISNLKCGRQRDVQEGPFPAIPNYSGFCLNDLYSQINIFPSGIYNILGVCHFPVFRMICRLWRKFYCSNSNLSSCRNILF
jgi:hypothetical protein